MEKILVGSKAFFGAIDGFTGTDSDYIELVENPQGFQWRREIRMRGTDTFQYRKESPMKMVQRTLESGDPLLVGKFLIPEFSAAIGATVQDIAPLEPLLAKLDKKHEYVAYIFRAIMDNGTFEITDQQRDEAYRIYTEARRSKERSRDNIKNL